MVTTQFWIHWAGIGAVAPFLKALTNHQIVSREELLNSNKVRVLKSRVKQGVGRVITACSQSLPSIVSALEELNIPIRACFVTEVADVTTMYYGGDLLLQKFFSILGGP